MIGNDAKERVTDLDVIADAGDLDFYVAVEGAATSVRLTPCRDMMLRLGGSGQLALQGVALGDDVVQGVLGNEISCSPVRSGGSPVVLLLQQGFQGEPPGRIGGDLLGGVRRIEAGQHLAFLTAWPARASTATTRPAISAATFGSMTASRVPRVRSANSIRTPLTWVVVMRVGGAPFFLGFLAAAGDEAGQEERGGAHHGAESARRRKVRRWFPAADDVVDAVAIDHDFDGAGAGSSSNSWPYRRRRPT